MDSQNLAQSMVEYLHEMSAGFLETLEPGELNKYTLHLFELGFFACVKCKGNILGVANCIDESCPNWKTFQPIGLAMSEKFDE